MVSEYKDRSQGSRVILPPVLDISYFYYKISKPGIIKFAGVFRDMPLDGDTVVLCYQWTEEELKARDMMVLRQIGVMIKNPRDMTIIRYFFDDHLNGYILDKAVKNDQITGWEDLDLGNATGPQKLEHKILERFKEMRVADPCYSGRDDRELIAIMAEYRKRFGKPDS